MLKNIVVFGSIAAVIQWLRMEYPHVEAFDAYLVGWLIFALLTIVIRYVLRS